MKKKIIITVVITILFLVLLFILILLPSLKNNNFNKNLIKNIHANTEIKDITYVNKSNNYYIVKTENKVMVLDLNYEEVFVKDSVRDSEMPLVYKRNNLYYVEKVREKNKLTYNYYSTDEDVLVFSSVVGGN